MGAGGSQKLFSVGICDGAPSTVRSSFVLFCLPIFFIIKLVHTVHVHAGHSRVVYVGFSLRLAHSS